ncbi:MAG: hypothetical protein SFV18_12710 [Bryobacteraceae bacterium]|nr:hypothetical protein [Bryobacteraceae bacterium]
MRLLSVFYILLPSIWGESLPRIVTLTDPDLLVRYGGRIPRYAGGNAIVAESHARSSAEAAIRLYDLQSGAWKTLNVWPDGEPVADLFVNQVSPLVGGRVAVAMRVVSGTNQRAEVLSVFGPAGRSSTRIRTNPLAFDSFAVDPQGRYWVFGVCPDYLAEQCGSEYSTVRGYSPDGREIASFLPASHIGPDAWKPRFPSETTNRIFAGEGRIGLYAGHFRHWIELDYEGHELARVPVTFPKGVTGIRLAMSDSGRVFASGNGSASLFELNKSSGEFERVGDFGGSLCGYENGSLVFMSFDVGRETRFRFVPLP